MFDFLKPRPSKKEIVQFAAELAELTANRVASNISALEYEVKLATIINGFHARYGC